MIGQGESAARPRQGSEARTEARTEARIEAPKVPTGPGGDPDWLGLAIDLARANVEDGGWPFGAVIVRDGILLATGVNKVPIHTDPTAHAELNAIRAACAAIDAITLTGAVLYSSCEPCPMCMAATMWADLAAVVYAADDDDAARAGFEDREIRQRLTRPRDAWPMSVRQWQHRWAERPLRAWTSRDSSVAG